MVHKSDVVTCDMMNLSIVKITRLPAVRLSRDSGNFLSVDSSDKSSLSVLIDAPCSAKVLGLYYLYLDFLLRSLAIFTFLAPEFPTFREALKRTRVTARLCSSFTAS